jgi:hypothetical protein
VGRQRLDETVLMPITGTPQQKKKQAFDEFKAGRLHSGRGGPLVKNKKQAIAIALSVARGKEGRKK